MFTLLSYPTGVDFIQLFVLRVVEDLRDEERVSSRFFRVS